VISDEEAKAAQEIAKLGQRSIDAASEAGGFFAKTFGEAIEHVSQALADKAAGYRIVNRAKVAKKTEERLEKLGVTVTNAKLIDYRNGIPLLEAISDEPNESLQDVWAAYFANALNPKNSSVTANRQLVNIIRQLEPEDLIVLDGLTLQELNELRAEHLTKKSVDFVGEEAVINRSLSRLTALGLFAFENGPDRLMAYSSGEPQPCMISIETSLGSFSAMPLLMFLKNAIEEPGASGRAPAVT
jgi:Fe-S oxidoreductase